MAYCLHQKLKRKKSFLWIIFTGKIALLFVAKSWEPTVASWYDIWNTIVYSFLNKYVQYEY